MAWASGYSITQYDPSVGNISERAYIISLTGYSLESAFIRQVCRDAGALTLQYFGSIKDWTEKSGRGDIVTVADHEVEDLIVARLQRDLPGHNLLTEERGWVRNDSAKPTWVLDPVDGTRNFAMGIPLYAISLAMIVDGVPQLGVIYDPVHDELYFAARGEGAKMNETPINIGNLQDLVDAAISVSWSPKAEYQNDFIKTVDRVNTHTCYLRRIGSAALVMAYVACGRYDGYIQAGINPWDIAAGLLLVQEAGGVVTNFQGGPIDVFQPNIDLVAANPNVHQIIIQDIMC